MAHVDVSPLPRTFYDRDVRDVARDSLGRFLLRAVPEGLIVGRIVEVEAYLSDGDPACHAFRGRTPRNAAMFGPPGHAYVYPIHARHCVNLVTEPVGTASAVLVRALEPLAGIELMQQRRQLEKLTLLTSGPARLCEALSINRELNSWNLTLGERLWLAAGEPVAPRRIEVSRRIGVTSAHDLELRFCIGGCRFVSP